MRKNFSSISDFRAFLHKNGVLASVEYDSVIHSYRIIKPKSVFIQSEEDLLDAIFKEYPHITIRNRSVSSISEIKV